jgi:hypothetical protein
MEEIKIKIMIRKKNSTTKKTVIHERIKRAYPDLELVLFDNDAQASEAVATKKEQMHMLAICPLVRTAMCLKQTITWVLCSKMFSISNKRLYGSKGEMTQVSHVR